MSERPSNASVDALFDGARRATIEAGPGFPGGLPRAPYHRHVLVIWREMACTLAGDRVIGVPLPG